MEKCCTVQAIGYVDPMENLNDWIGRHIRVYPGCLLDPHWAYEAWKLDTDGGGGVTFAAFNRAVKAPRVTIKGFRYYRDRKLR